MLRTKLVVAGTAIVLGLAALVSFRGRGTRRGAAKEG